MSHWLGRFGQPLPTFTTLNKVTLPYLTLPYGKKPLPLEEVLEILEEYQERSLPTSSNLKEILVKIARAEFVTKPFLPILKIREGMGEFWDSVSQEEIESVYAMCTPSPSRVISLLHITPLNTQERKIARWLKRFLKEADSITLGLFLRFCTGNDMAIPGCQIKVRFENMVLLAMRPMARTCFRVLTLPRTYQTYHQLRKKFGFLHQEYHPLGSRRLSLNDFQKK